MKKSLKTLESKNVQSLDKTRRFSIVTALRLFYKLAVPKIGLKGKVLVTLLLVLCVTGIGYQLHVSMADFAVLTRIDPLPHTQRLIQEKRYAEAHEYLSYFMEYDYIASDPEAIALYNEIEKERNSYLYDLEKIAKGILHGHSDESSGQIAAIVTDFLVIGDIRDLAIEGNNWWHDEEVDKFIVALSTIGVTATAGTLVTAGGTAIAKPVVSFFKMANKVGKIPKWLRNYLIKSAQIVKETKKLDHLTELFDTVYTSCKVGGTRSTLILLNKADDIHSFKKFAQLNTKFGNKTAVLLDIAGDTGFKTVNKLDDIPKNVVLEASTFGKEGILKLNSLGVERFQKFLNTVKMATRTTKVAYKHHEIILNTVLKGLQNLADFLPTWLLGFIVVYSGFLLFRKEESNR